MFENNTDRMFWTIAVLILGATLLMIGNRAFPKAQESIMSTLSQNIKTSNNSADKLSNDIQSQKPSYPVYNKDYWMDFNRNNGTVTANLHRYNGPNTDHIDIPAWTYDEQTKQNVPVVSINGTDDRIGPFNYKGIKSITIPNTIEVIGNSAFWGNHIESVYIPEAVTVIRQWAFEGNNLKTITIPKNVRYVGERVFDSNPLESIKFQTTNVTVGNNLIQNTKLTQETKDYLLKHFNNPLDGTNPGNSAYK